LSGLAGKRILVVEDEALIAELVADMLLDLGARVVGPAYSLKKAMELATVEEIDGAVLDVNIRSERVDPVAEVLRQRTVPIVFASGNGDMIAGLADGAPVLEKPYTQEKLGDALSKALDMRSQSSRCL
jgi:DNA-binding response OmpR family regulator